MRPLLVLLTGGLLSAAAAPPLAAQQYCDLLPEPRTREATRLATPAGEIIYIRGPARFACTGDVTVQADSVESHSATGELRLIGRVFYADTIKSLNADRVNYFGRDGRLFAQGSIVLRDRRSESVIRGRELEYRAAREGRPETRTVVRGRPSAVLYPRASDEPAAPARPLRPPAPGLPPVPDSDRPPEPSPGEREPFHVDSDIMEILGERYFHAVGTVELRRGDTRGWAREATFDQDEERLVLTGDARIEDDDFELTAARIEAWLEGESLREVDAERDALLLAEDLRVDAPALRMFFQEGELHRMVARGAAPGPGILVAEGDPGAAELRMPGEPRLPIPLGITAITDDAPVARPLISAPDFLLQADSIDARLPAQRLEEVIAVGAAYGERVPDSLDLALPAVLSRDWVSGDTIIGYFTTAAAAETEPVVPDTLVADLLPDAEPAPDVVPASAPAPGGAGAEPSAEERVVLERLVAIANEDGEARALYRLREEDEAEDRPGANYIIATRITLRMVEGEVKEVEADGPLRGIYIDPLKSTDEDAPGTAATGRNRGR